METRQSEQHQVPKFERRYTTLNHLSVVVASRRCNYIIDGVEKEKTKAKRKYDEICKILIEHLLNIEWERGGWEKRVQENGSLCVYSAIFVRYRLGISFYISIEDIYEK